MVKHETYFRLRLRLRTKLKIKIKVKIKNQQDSMCPSRLISSNLRAPRFPPACTPLIRQNWRRRSRRADGSRRHERGSWPGRSRPHGYHESSPAVSRDIRPAGQMFAADPRRLPCFLWKGETVRLAGVCWEVVAVSPFLALTVSFFSLRPWPGSSLHFSYLLCIAPHLYLISVVDPA